ncbi:MAG: hypothetical protein BWX93_00189 [Bacteroidetes bacterium ADurb.Bin139]|nr:MAG: hypothetical protein BWX93_00189 [Bacteroidetes bacterium ADurb.Bin139]HOZ19685.1 hypothetical protein [Bacteroidales bacterium]HPB77414.1 hypothetical protein [Bacteroidales bacterium]HPK39217.1 hypothetical protein [Bacteroidales bacterium]HQN81123.1 hypothetical protein [Bacteroidales bacterium]
MSKVISYTIAAALLVVFGYIAGIINNNRQENGDFLHTDTTTVTAYDTIQVRIPEPVVSRSAGIEVYPIAQVPVLLFHSDTVTKPYFVNNDLVIPITQRYYKDPRFEAWISGYNPRLDSVNVFVPTRVQTITNTVEKIYRNEVYVNGKLSYVAPFPVMAVGLEAGYTRDRWGLSVGAGVLSTTVGVKWYGSVGLNYNFIKTQW